jgi:ComF family protein
MAACHRSATIFTGMVYKKKKWFAMSTTGGNNAFINSLLDFFLPRFCVACSIKLNPSENSLCNSCLLKIKRASTQRLEREFDRKFRNSKIISDFFSLYIFEKDKELQHAIHALKYNNNFSVGKFLGQQLANTMMSENKIWNIDLIIPIPLHQLKKAERGYNQSFYIAKGVNKILKKKISTRDVKRTRYTESQTSMNLTEREENISGAFKVIFPNAVKDRTILLIDDIITTGATISECGRVLLEAGSKNIFAASVGIAD